MEVLTLDEYIKREHNGIRADFAEVNGIKRQQVTTWLKNDFVVIGGRLYSERRKLVKASPFK